MTKTNTMTAAYADAATQRHIDVLVAWNNGATKLSDRVTLAAWHLAGKEYGLSQRILKSAQRVFNANPDDVEAKRTLEAAEVNVAAAKFMLDLIMPHGKAARADAMLDYAVKMQDFMPEFARDDQPVDTSMIGDW